MRIVCSGMPRARRSEASLPSLQKTVLGRIVVQFIQEAVDAAYIQSGSVKQYLRKFQDGIKDGTCYGDATAVIIAALKTDNQVRKDFAARACKIAKISDRICYQIIEELSAEIACNITSTKRRDKNKEHVHKSHLQIKEELAVEMTSPVLLAKSKLRSNILQIEKMYKKSFRIPAFHEANNCLEKLRELARNFSVRSQKSLPQVFHIRRSNTRTQQVCMQKILECLKKVRTSDREHELMVRFGFCTNGGGGHAIAIFLHKKGSRIAGTIYDTLNTVDRRDAVLQKSGNMENMVVRSFTSFQDLSNRLKRDLKKELDPQGSVLVEVFKRK